MDVLENLEISIKQFYEILDISTEIVLDHTQQCWYATNMIIPFSGMIFHVDSEYATKNSQKLSPTPTSLFIRII